MIAPLVFLDTETTGLGLDDDIWEFAAIRRDPDGDTTTWHCHITHSLDKAARLPDEFRADHDARYRPDDAITPAELAYLLVTVVFAVPVDTPYDLRPHVIGAVPSFDTTRLELLLRRHDHVRPPWHHHIQDVETLALGYIAAMGRSTVINRFTGYAWRVPPIDSEQLSALLGVDPNLYEGHTALGDARWAMAIWDLVMNGPQPC